MRRQGFELTIADVDSHRPLPWQLEEAANHQPYYPAKSRVFCEALAKADIQAVGAVNDVGSKRSDIG